MAAVNVEAEQGRRVGGVIEPRLGSGCGDAPETGTAGEGLVGYS